MKAEREQGYYWVKTEHNTWHVARWNKEFGQYRWTVCFSKFAMYDQDFVEIDENRITRKMQLA